MDFNEILTNVREYNSIIYDINNSHDWNYLILPIELINKQTITQYKIIQSIIEYCIVNKKLSLEINTIVNNIFNNFLKSHNQLINIKSFKTHISHLLR
jgi:hypothetical protein